MEKICSECSETTLAQSLCTLCNKWLCYQCTDVHQHQRAPATSQCADLHQQHRPSAPQCPEQHQRGSSSMPPNGQGPGSYPCSLLMCHSHRQEPLELFCESCDLLCCSSCHLSAHKNHRVVQIEKALQDQLWLFESLTVQVEERRSAVESNAKEIEGRLHGVKIAHRKAENQIKMAKMIMMNELNKRANLLIEQLEKISEDFQQRLDDQLQGAIEICGQLDHVQKFFTWATTHHCRGPVLFSRALISLQMQQLLEPSLHSESWSPVKIKFNWDASYWMRQISSLGQLTVEGGNCIYPQSLSCSTVMRPQPIACMALPPVFHRREPGCGCQSCCEPQMCCLHGLTSQPEPSNPDKRQVEASLYGGCVQPALTSAPLQQSQQLQRCWDTQSSTRRPPPTSPVPFMKPTQLTCGRGAAPQPQAADSQPHSQSKSYLSYHPHHREVPPGGQAPLSADRSRSGQCQGKQQELSHAAAVMTDESWEERCRAEETCGRTAAGDSRELLDEELQQDRAEQSPAPQQQQQQQQQPRVPPAAEVGKEQQRTRPSLTLRDHRDGRRSTSLEVPATAHDCVSDVQSSRLSPSSTCARRTRRSQSIPAELAAPSTRPTGCTRVPEAGNKYASVDPRQRRASDGVLCVVKETSSDMALPRGHRHPLLSYKTEPDHGFTYVNEEIDCEAKETCRLSRNSSRDDQKDSARPRVPVVCLERLKILVSQLPPHGRRQSDPLPAGSMEKSETLPQQKLWLDAKTQRLAGGSETRRPAHSPAAPLYAAERQTHNQFTALFESRGRFLSRKASAPPSTDPEYVPQNYTAQELDSDSYLKSLSEDPAAFLPADPDPHADSDSSPPDSDANAESSFEAELGYLAEEKSEAAGETGLCSGTSNAGGSEPSLEYDEYPESEGEAGSEDGQGLDADTESDAQSEYAPRFQADSKMASDQAPDSQGSVESELDVESEAEFTTDDPQPLRSDLEEESSPIEPGQRSLLIANPGPLRGPEDVQSEQDDAEMESEDFCAVCLIGGDLLCCDRCPKVFHLSCHVPSLLTFPTGDWVCSLCRDAVHPEVEYDCENERASGEGKLTHGPPASDQRKCERLTLLILSNVLSAPFHEPVSPLARHYYQIIKSPMDLSVIRARLQKRNARHYNSADQFVADFYLMFRNCAKFNYPDSEVAQAGRSLVAFFTSKLKEVFPDRVFPAVEADSDSDEYDEAYRTAEGGFPWPERREQCHRKRKRRHSLKSRRHHF